MLNIVLILCLNAIFFSVAYILISRKIENKFERESILEDIRSEVNQLVVELNQTTDRNIDLIEQKIHELNDTLSHADKRINLFQKETEKHDMSAKVYNDILKKRPLPRKEEEPKVEATPSTRDQVIDLFKKGFSAEIIANKVGATISEVELIISLKGE